jgi:hypothetical protein
MKSGSLDYEMTMDAAPLQAGAQVAQDTIAKTKTETASLGQTSVAITRTYGAMTQAMQLMGVQAAPQLTNAVATVTGTMLAMKGAAVAAGASMGVVAAAMLAVGAAIATATQGMRAWLAIRSERVTGEQTEETLEGFARKRIEMIRKLEREGTFSRELAFSLTKGLEEGIESQDPGKLSEALRTAFRFMVRHNVSESQQGARDSYGGLVDSWMMEGMVDPLKRGAAEIDRWAQEQKEKLRETLTEAGYGPDVEVDKIRAGDDLIERARRRKLADLQAEPAQDTKWSEIEKMGFVFKNGAGLSRDDFQSRIARASEATVERLDKLIEKPSGTVEMKNL